MVSITLFFEDKVIENKLKVAKSQNNISARVKVETLNEETFLKLAEILKKDDFEMMMEISHKEHKEDN